MAAYCCERMRDDLERHCPDHPDRFSCPDALVYYSPQSGVYGLIIHDGGTSFTVIDYCPWCGTRLVNRPQPPAVR